MDLRQGTQYWERIANQFAHTFEFANENPTIDVALQTVKEKIFAEIPIKEANSHQCRATIQQYSLTGDPDDDPTNINISEAEGTREVEGSRISSDRFHQPLKIKKVHIGSPKKPKLTNIRYYWDE